MGVITGFKWSFKLKIQKIGFSLSGITLSKMEVSMKKHELIIEDEYDDEEGVWLDTGDSIIKLPPELLPYLRETDILGLA